MSSSDGDGYHSGKPIERKYNMTHKHINLIYPQWQGGGPDMSTYDGALELHSLYFNHVPVTAIPVGTEETIRTENGIFGYPDIVRQLDHVHQLLGREQPDTVFTVGGGCDVSVPAVSFLNARLNGNLTVLWLDAHSDLNTPQTSESQCFYGMPLRALLGDGDSRIVGALESTLTPAQVMLPGTRAIDAPEREFIDQHHIPVLPVEAIERDPEAVVEAARGKGSGVLYVHIDLDVLEPSAFPHTPLPTADGISPEALRNLLRRLSEEFVIAGMCLAEYQPAGGQRFGWLADIIRIGTSLAR